MSSPLCSPSGAGELEDRHGLRKGGRHREDQASRDTAQRKTVVPHQCHILLAKFTKKPVKLLLLEVLKSYARNSCFCLRGPDIQCQPHLYHLCGSDALETSHQHQAANSHLGQAALLLHINLKNCTEFHKTHTGLSDHI